MARENQGLQIALIVFVMLTILLGVTTFIFVGRYDEALGKVKAGQAEATESRNQITNLTADSARLKEMIGVPPADSLQEIEKLFNEDMQKYAGKRDDGGALPEDQKFYRPLLEQLFVTISARDGQLVAKEEQIRKCEQDRADAEEKAQSQIKKYKEAAVAASADQKKESESFASEQTRIAEEKSKIATQLEKTRKDSQTAVAEKEKEVGTLTGTVTEMATKNKLLADRLGAVTKEVADAPLGEIRWVNQAAGTVWINLGLADSLPRQMTFSVYSPNATDLTKAGRKASIEVTQIKGEKLAEARILDDKASDPVMPGDKIFTPVWRPGEKKHFALAGIMDLNGDGKSDLQTVKNLITMNGGVVDCEPTEKGDERVGEMTVNTRYLVLGTEPRGEAGIAVWSRMDGDATRLGIKRVSLGDLLEQMGYKNQAPVTQYGAQSNPGGNTTFSPRKPPGAGN